MTIKEAINHAKEVADKKYKEGFLCYANSGVVENDKKNDECVECAKEHEQLAEWLEELRQYRSIGTIKECREARERQMAKKPIKTENNGFRYTDSYICQNCGKGFTGTGIADFCYHCGQAIDWSDTD